MRATVFVIGLLLLATPSLAQSEQPASPARRDSAVQRRPPAARPRQTRQRPRRRQRQQPAPSQPAHDGPKLLISTSMGDITLQLDAQRAPKSVANVLRYVREKHYDGTASIAWSRAS